MVRKAISEESFKEGDKLEFENLLFMNTCFVCPEQYDIFTKEYRLVGYARLRWGKFIVNYGDVGGPIVYEKEFKDKLKGSFSSSEERSQQLSIAANKIKDYINELKKR